MASSAASATTGSLLLADSTMTMVDKVIKRRWRKSPMRSWPSVPSPRRWFTQHDVEGPCRCWLPRLQRLGALHHLAGVHRAQLRCRHLPRRAVAVDDKGVCAGAEACAQVEMEGGFGHARRGVRSGWGNGSRLQRTRPHLVPQRGAALLASKGDSQAARRLVPAVVRGAKFHDAGSAQAHGTYPHQAKPGPKDSRRKATKACTARGTWAE